MPAVADEFVTEVERARVQGSIAVDSRRLQSAAVEKMVCRRIEPLLKAGADKIVLGCTHFPHLKPVIEKVCAGRAEVIDPSDAVARQAKRMLEKLRG